MRPTGLPRHGRTTKTKRRTDDMGGSISREERMRKKVWSVTVAALLWLGLLLSGCGARNSPERVVGRYFDAVKAGDLEEAISCFQPSVQKQYQAATSLSDSLLGAFGLNVDSDALLGGLVGMVNSETYRDYEFRVSSVTQSETDRATVSVDVQMGAGQSVTTCIPCVCIGGEWFIEK